MEGWDMATAAARNVGTAYTSWWGDLLYVLGGLPTPVVLPMGLLPTVESVDMLRSALASSWAIEDPGNRTWMAHRMSATALLDTLLGRKKLLPIFASYVADIFDSTSATTNLPSSSKPTRSFWHSSRKGRPHMRPRAGC
ncbi:hypothetical protein VTO73DRAFT_11551 [Trametes versicolor]